MYKNIFLELYENPETAEEMSLEMGIALPYMESELEFLVRETFLTKEGNKYRTAFPIVDKEKQKDRTVLQGDVPSPINLPKGCVFASRCPNASERCRQERPQLREIKPNHFVSCHLFDVK